VHTATQTITVGVDAGTPIAGTPTVSTPNLTTGTVSGTAVFSDTPGRTLTYSAPATSKGGGTVAISNPSTGAFTFTPTTTQRRSATTTTTDTITITVSNGVRTTTQTITVAVDPGTPAAGSPTVSAPNASTGVVSGTAKFTDPNGRTLAYSAATKSAASNGTFTITASNGARTATQTVTVAVLPASTPSVAGDNLTALPGRPEGPPRAGKNGMLYQTSVKTVSGGHLTYVTVVQPNGTTTNYSQTSTIYNGPVVGPDGSVYQTSTTGTDGYDFTRYTTVLQVLRSDGTTVRYTQPGTLNSNFQPVIGADGSVYQLSSTGTSSGPITVLQVVRPNGTSTQYTHPGSSSDNAVFAPNGTAYQVTSTYNNADQSSATIVTAVNPNGITTEYALNGSGTVKFGPNNTAFLNGYVINPNASTQGG